MVINAIMIITEWLSVLLKRKVNHCMSRGTYTQWSYLAAIDNYENDSKIMGDFNVRLELIYTF